MLAPDTKLQDRYRIVRQLGQGGMGAVYEAVDERLDTTVALKETLFTDEKLRKQFEREARLLARLHHQALPRVSDHFNEDSGQFLVMQYIAGEDLFEMLAQKKGPFPQDEVLRWGDQLCDALDYLHTQDPQIIHRDIKPQNLKLTTRGQMVLLDFGLAKGSGGQMSVVTTSASIFGYTPNYAPLEQVQGLGTDPRSDIYSLCATLYHLLTNVKPPDALSRAGALVNGQSDPLVSANQVTPQVSAAVAAVLNKGMSQKRDDRFASAELLRESLRVASTQSAGIGDAATVLASGVAAGTASNTVASDRSTRMMSEQTQSLGSEAQTVLANDATKVRGATAAGEAVTVIRPAATAARPSRMWLAAALLLVIVGGAAGGVYIYRVRHNQAQSAAPVSENPTQTNQSASPSPANSQTTTATQGNEPKSEKPKAESATVRSVTTKQTTERAAETSTPAKTKSEEVTTTHESDRSSDRSPDRARDTNTGPPPFDPRNQQGRHPGRLPGPGDAPNVRTFPNGSKVTTQADGTRIVTMPNGTTRVFPPGVKPNRKPNRNP